MVTRSNHMRQSGRDLEVIDRRLGLAQGAEPWFAERYGGTLSTLDQDMSGKWDVVIGTTRYDIKTIEPYHRFVNAGNHRPRYSTPVIEVSDGPLYRLLGIVKSRRYVKGVPRVGFIECWYVDVGEIDPATRLSAIVGTPLTEPRPCPACDDLHPVGTTCDRGWSAWRVPLPWEID